jgi:hypothetical protein
MNTKYINIRRLTSWDDSLRLLVKWNVSTDHIISRAMDELESAPGFPNDVNAVHLTGRAWIACFNGIYTIVELPDCDK